jgi:hypothetical protein
VVETVVGGLVVAALGGLWVSVRRRAGAWLARRHPLDVSVERIVREPWSLAFAEPLRDCTEIEAGSPSATEAHARLRARGGLDLHATRLRLRLRNTATETLVISGIRVETKRADPADGCRVFCPTAGVNAATLLVIDLDEDDAVPWQFREDGVRKRLDAAPFFDNHNIALGQDEVHDLVVVGTTKLWTCAWRLLVEVEVGRRRSTIVVDDDGKPFRTAGLPAGGFTQSLLWAWWEGGGLVPEDMEQG